MYYTEQKSLWLTVHEIEDAISKSSCLAILAEELNMYQFATIFVLRFPTYE